MAARNARMAELRELMRIQKLALLAIFAFLLPAALAQSQATTGTIEGRVTDASGAVIAGAAVQVTAQETGAQRTTKTNNEGLFQAPLLPSGLYGLEVRAAGFRTAVVKDIQVTVGQRAAVDLTLQVGEVTQAVEVSAEGAAVETTQSTAGAVIDSEMIGELPLNGRRYTDFVLLTPGVVPDGNFGNISFNGAPGNSNGFQLDGADVTNGFYSTTSAGQRAGTRAPFLVSAEAIREFRVSSSNFSAEFGRASGGLINTVTRSGTNHWHGSGFYFLRDSATSANDYINKANGQARLKDRRQQFGGILGGPIRRDRVFYFSSYEQQKRNQPYTVTLPRDLITGLDRANASAASTVQFLESLGGPAPRAFSQWTTLQKLDWQLNDRHSLTLTYNFQKFDSPNGTFTSPTANVAQSANSSEFVTSHTGSLQWRAIVSSSLFNEFRYQYGLDDRVTTPNGPGPGVSIRGFRFNRNTGLPRGLDERRHQINNNVSAAWGVHTFKFGGEYTRLTDQNLFPGAAFGSYSFETVTDLAAGRYSFYTQNFEAVPGAFGLRLRAPSYAGFIDDSYRVHPSLTLNLGLRYDFQSLPQPKISNPNYPATSRVPIDKNNVVPRFGFAWSPAFLGRGKTVFRGGYGIFYQQFLLQDVNDALTGNAAMQVSYGLNGPANRAPDALSACLAYPSVAASPLFFTNPVEYFRTNPTPQGCDSSVLRALPTRGLASLNVYESNYGLPYIQQMSLEVERELARRTILAVGWRGTRGVHLQRSRNINTPAAPVQPPVRVTFPGGPTVTAPDFSIPAAARPEAAFSFIDEFQAAGSSVYNALAVRLNRQMSRGFAAFVSYTWAHAIDVGLTSYNPYDFRIDRATSANDQRQRLALSGVWQPDAWRRGGRAHWLIAGWRFSTLTTLASGQHRTAFMAGVAGINSGRPPGLGRNTVELPGTVSTDLRASRRFRLSEDHTLEILAEGFNLFNRANYFDVNTTQYDIRGRNPDFTLQPNPSFRLPRTSSQLYPARQFQFALRWRF